MSWAGRRFDLVTIAKIEFDCTVFDKVLMAKDLFILFYPKNYKIQQ